MKKIVFLLIVVVFLFGCSTEVREEVGKTIYVYKNHVNDDEKNITQKNVAVKIYEKENVNEERKVDVYFLDDKTFWPYVEFNEFFSKFFTDLSTAKIDLNSNKATYTAKDCYDYEQTLEFDWANNILNTSSGSISFRDSFLYDSAKNVPQILMLPSYYTKGNPISFNFSEYGFDILFYKGKCLVPFGVIQTLFCERLPYTFFNGTEFSQSEDYLITNQFDLEKSYDFLNQFFGGNFGKENPNYFKELTANTLLMQYNYSYGNKEFFELYLGKGIINSLFNRNIVSSVFSGTQKEFTQGILNFLYSMLDYYNQPLNSLSLFWDGTLKDTGFKDTKQYKDFSETVLTYINAKGEQKEVNLSDSGKTIVVNIAEFSSSICYQAMTNLFLEIDRLKTEGKSVQNIVIDISTCYEGDTDAIQILLGFMTATPSFTVYDTLDKSYKTYQWKVDTNGDNLFNEADIKSGYNWYILTSPATGGMPHIFSVVADFNGIATLVGRETYGNDCLLIQLNLPDGTVLYHSSRFAFCGSKLVYEKIFDENGVLVDNPQKKVFAYSNYLRTLEGIMPSIIIDNMDSAFYSNLANNVEANIENSQSQN